MAESQYIADSARDPDAFVRPLPHHLMLSAALHPDARLPVAYDRSTGPRHPLAPIGIDLPAQAAFTSITLHH